MQRDMSVGLARLRAQVQKIQRAADACCVSCKRFPQSGGVQARQLEGAPPEPWMPKCEHHISIRPRAHFDGRLVDWIEILPRRPSAGYGRLHLSPEQTEQFDELDGAVGVEPCPGQQQRTVIGELKREVVHGVPSVDDGEARHAA